MDERLELEIESVEQFRGQLVQMQNQLALFKLVHPEWFREVRLAANGVGDSIENIDELLVELKEKL